MRTLPEEETDIPRGSDSGNASGFLKFSVYFELLFNKEPMAPLPFPLDFPMVSGEGEAPILLNLTGELFPKRFALHV